MRERSIPHRAPVAGHVLTFVVAVALTVASVAYVRENGDPRAQIRAGGAAVLLGELERTSAVIRTPADELVRGHALAALGRRDEALAAFALAARGGAADQDALDVALAGLGDEDSAASAAVIRACSDRSIVDSLAELSRRGAWLPRHRALALLEERGERGRVDLEAFAIRDLMEGDSCGRRKAGLEMLRRQGRTIAALKALHQARERDDGCLRHLLGPIESTLRVTTDAGYPRR